MSEFKAKPILNDKFWLLEDSTGTRIGTVHSKNDSVKVNIDGAIHSFDDLDSACSTLNIKFVAEAIETNYQKDDGFFLDGYPTKSFPHNHIYDAQSKLHLFTKEEKSESYHCAGYFALKFKSAWTASFCPRASTLMKNDWEGPFKSEIDMNAALKRNNERLKN